MSKNSSKLLLAFRPPANARNSLLLPFFDHLTKIAPHQGFSGNFLLLGMCNSFYRCFIPVLFLSLPLHAWHGHGHQLIASMTKSLLKKNIRDSVQHYLDTTSFEDAAVWMDVVRGNPAFNYLKRAHYINIEKDKTYVKTTGTNIINSIDLARQSLSHRKGKSQADIKLQLLLLFHLVGDLHQPLHVGYEADKGGNNIPLYFNHKKTNLHKLWDGDLINYENITLQSCQALLKTLDNRQVQTFRQINVLGWMEESRALLPVVYNFSNDQINSDYADKNKLVLEMQLLKAALRLTALLEDAFQS